MKTKYLKLVNSILVSIPLNVIDRIEQELYSFEANKI